MTSRQKNGRADNCKRISVLIFGEYRYPIYQEACSRALEELGVKVWRVSYGDYLTNGLWGRMQERLCCGPLVKKINSLLLEKVKCLRPDITFIYNSVYIKLSTLRQLSELTWLAGYTNDNPFGGNSWRPTWKNFRKTIPYYHSWHVYRPANLRDFEKVASANTHLLMGYYLPWETSEKYFRKRTSFDNDVVFVGHGENDIRIKCVEALFEANIFPKIYGDPLYWKRFLPRIIYNALPGIKPAARTEYRYIVRHSKISLAFLSSSNEDVYTRRCFEIPSWNGFLLAQRTEFLQGLYREGLEAEYFDSPEELVGKCKKYLINAQLREQIANCGRSRCIEGGHDVISRMEKWLDETKRAMAASLRH